MDMTTQCLCVIISTVRARTNQLIEHSSNDTNIMD